MIYRRIFNYSVLVAGIVSFLVWMLISELDLSSAIPNPKMQEIIKIIIGSIFSYGFFNIMISLLFLLIENCIVCKKFIYSNTYVEGVWIGFCTPINTNTNDLLITIEEIIQNVENITITGRLYKAENFIYYGAWRSNEATFDDAKHSLIYTHITDSTYIDGLDAGFSVYNYVSRGKKSPKICKGYSSDSIHIGKSVIMSKKLCDLGHNYDEKEIWEAAKKYYDDHKEIFIGGV